MYLGGQLPGSLKSCQPGCQKQLLCGKISDSFQNLFCLTVFLIITNRFCPSLHGKTCYPRCLHAVRGARASRYCEANVASHGQLRGVRGLGLVCMVESGGFPSCFGLPGVVLLFSPAVRRQAYWLCLVGAWFRAELLGGSLSAVV